MTYPLRSTLAISILLLSTILSACAGGESVAQEDPPATLESENDRVSYAIGMNFARSLAAQEVEPDVELLVKGLRDGFGEGSPLMTDEEVQQTLQSFADTMRTEMAERREAQGMENQEEGEAFLARNREKAGVEETASGLQYEVLEEGEGPTPAAEQQVRVHYQGSLLDGTVFDSSYERGEPVVFPVNRVIAGWSEALQMMPVGSKWKLWIPADLAYGEQGAGDQIGPNATLVFEVELLGIEQQ